MNQGKANLFNKNKRVWSDCTQIQSGWISSPLQEKFPQGYSNVKEQHPVSQCGIRANSGTRDTVAKKYCWTNQSIRPCEQKSILRSPKKAKLPHSALSSHSMKATLAKSAITPHILSYGLQHEAGLHHSTNACDHLCQHNALTGHWRPWNEDNIYICYCSHDHQRQLGIYSENYYSIMMLPSLPRQQQPLST